MRVLKRDRTASTVIRDHALILNIRRGHYELRPEAELHLWIVDAFDQLAEII
jgi:hypothetical protein